MRRKTESRPTEAAAGGSKRRRNLSATRGESERVAVWLSRDVMTRLRVYAAQERVALSVAVEEAVSDFLRARNSRRQP